MHSENAPRTVDRRGFLKLGGAGLAGAALLGTAGGGVFARTGSSLGAEFEAASREYGVPKELLLAMGHVNTLWEMPPPGAADYEPGDLHGFGAYGIMQLYQNPSRDTLGEAANLTGLSEEKLKTNRAANIRGGAAVLADIAGDKKPDTLNGWHEVVTEYGGIDLYATDVYAALRSGVSATISTGQQVKLAPQKVEVPETYGAQSARSADYRRAVWRPASRYNYSPSRREGSANIYRIVVHVVQGSAGSAVNWFRNPAAEVSAHYVVGSRGGIVQCVRHKDIAWHAGNWAYNVHSIGIEHEGWAGNRRTWTDAMYHASARLAAHCCRRHNIPVNRKHIVEHRRVPGTDHYCPGRYFDRKRYLRLIRRYK